VLGAYTETSTTLTNVRAKKHPVLLLRLEAGRLRETGRVGVDYRWHVGEVLRLRRLTVHIAGVCTARSAERAVTSL
jgi:hypothetical protein